MKIPVPKLPPRLLVDLRTDCNLKCPMCIVHGGTSDPRLQAFLRRRVNIEDAQKLLDEVMHARPLIQPNMWSEPLLAPDFKEFVLAAKQRGVSIALNTNGLLLKPELAAFLVEEKVDSVSISIDAVTPETLNKVRGIDKLDKVERAVFTMLEARADKELPRVGVSFTIQAENKHEHDEFISRWSKIVDFVRVGEVFVDGSFPSIKIEGARSPCPSLYTTLAVHVDGQASICCLDSFGETDLGNVYQDGVEQVWNGEKFNEVRHYHETGQWEKVPFCINCDRWQSYEFEDEVRDGLLIRKSSEFTYYNRLDRMESWGEALQWVDYAKSNDQLVDVE